MAILMYADMLHFRNISLTNEAYILTMCIPYDKLISSLNVVK